MPANLACRVKRYGIECERACHCLPKLIANSPGLLAKWPAELMLASRLASNRPIANPLAKTVSQRKSKKSKAMQLATVGQRAPANRNDPSSIEVVLAKGLCPGFVWPGFAATILAGLAIALAVSGAIVNARYYAALGQTTWDSDLLAVFGLVVDGVTFALPTVASAMWRAQRRASAISAWIIVAGFMVLTMIATASFTSQNIGDAMAARAGVIADAKVTADQRARAIEIAQWAADTATSARQAECAIRGPRCRDYEAAERAALAELTKANSLPIEKAPEISTEADPGAHMIGSLLGNIGITERRVQYARTAGLTVAPATAGLLLSFSMMLFGPRRPQTRDNGGLLRWIIWVLRALYRLASKAMSPEHSTRPNIRAGVDHRRHIGGAQRIRSIESVQALAGSQS
jgi:hypothetical protein